MDNHRTVPRHSEDAGDGLRRYAVWILTRMIQPTTEASRSPRKALISPKLARSDRRIARTPLLNGYGANIGNVRGMEPMNFKLFLAMDKRKPRQYLSISGTEPFQAALNGIIESFGKSIRHNRNKTNSAKVRKSFKKRKRNPVQIVKQNHSPEEADDFDVRCMGSDRAGQVKTG